MTSGFLLAVSSINTQFLVLGSILIVKGIILLVATSGRDNGEPRTLYPTWSRTR